MSDAPTVRPDLQLVQWNQLPAPPDAESYDRDRIFTCVAAALLTLTSFAAAIAALHCAATERGWRAVATCGGISVGSLFTAWLAGRHLRSEAIWIRVNAEWDERAVDEGGREIGPVLRTHQVAFMLNRVTGDLYNDDASSLIRFKGVALALVGTHFFSGLSLIGSLGEMLGELSIGAILTGAGAPVTRDPVPHHGQPEAPRRARTWAEWRESTKRAAWKTLTAIPAWLMSCGAALFAITSPHEGRSLLARVKLWHNGQDRRGFNGRCRVFIDYSAPCYQPLDNIYQSRYVPVNPTPASVANNQAFFYVHQMRHPILNLLGPHDRYTSRTLRPFCCGPARALILPTQRPAWA